MTTPTVPRSVGKHAEREANEDLPKSRVGELWKRYFDQLAEIDKLETRLDERAIQTRRRVTNILHQAPTHRKSRLRMFVSHEFDNASPGQATYKLMIEGKLLVGHLDHDSANRFDANDNSTSGGLCARAESPSAVEFSSRGSRSKSAGEEEEEAVKPATFSHLFDRLEVEIQTIYQPISSDKLGAYSPPKKSRSAKRKSTATPRPEDVAPVDVKELRSSEIQNIVWNRNDTDDSHAFCAVYPNHYSDRPPPPGHKFHSVAATIYLYGIQPVPMYRPSPELAEKLFPTHKTLQPPRLVAKRRKLMGQEPHEPEPIPLPLENDMYIPSLLTMEDVISCFFQYCLDKKLFDAAESSTVVCDSVLSSLFDAQSFNFSQLQELLLSRKLVIQVKPGEDPCVLTYIMTESTVAPQEPPSSKSSKASDLGLIDPLATEVTPTIMSFDMDIAVPSLFPFRIREMLRRVKRREFEYTSSRTKARYLLVAAKGNEETIKFKIEEAVSGRGYAPENIPIHMALARAAPPNSEARACAQSDARMCALIQRVEECSQAAEAAWELVDSYIGHDEHVR